MLRPTVLLCEEITCRLNVTSWIGSTQNGCGQQELLTNLYPWSLTVVRLWSDSQVNKGRSLFGELIYLGYLFSSPLRGGNAAESSSRKISVGWESEMGRGGQKTDSASEDGGRGASIFTWEEVQKHSRRGDQWLVINRKVYNISNWVKRHPGGIRVISHYAGEDATVNFKIQKLIYQSYCCPDKKDGVEYSWKSSDSSY